MLHVERVRTDRTELYAAVSASLWLQREALENLLYALGIEQLIVSSGSTRWLARADDAAREAMSRVQCGELGRAAEVDVVLRSLGMDAETSLEQLSQVVPEPWSTLFGEHRSALRALAYEIEATAEENRRLLDAGARAVRETLAGLGTLVSGYGEDGRAVRTGRVSLLLDEQA